jgi:hypothetical protein
LYQENGNVEGELTAKEISSRGGKARFAKLTPEQRSQVARNAVQARWRKYMTVEKVIDQLRKAMAKCNAPEKALYEALVEESEWWKIRLKELEAEDEDGSE